MANYLSPLSSRQFIDANGNPYSGALLFTYSTGSTTKVTTYKDSAGSSSYTNPIVLNTRGEPADGSGVAYPIWQIGGTAVKYVLAPSTDTDPPASPIETWDNISGINDTSVTIDQWVTGPTPTYVNGTQFTLVGDQTTNFHIGRRVKATVTAGTVYGTITVSVYTSLTTITVVLDSGALDSGLSAISYGLLTSSNPSIPGVIISGNDWTHQGPVTNQGTVTMTSKAINEAKGADVTVAATTNIWTPGDGQTIHLITGGTISSFGTAPQAGARRHCVVDTSTTLTNGANLIVPGGSFTFAAGATFDVFADTTTKMLIDSITKADGTPLALLDGSVTAAKFSSATAGTIASYTSTGSAACNATGSAVPMKKIYCPYAGTFTTTLNISTVASTGSTVVRIYKNGVAFGTAHTNNTDGTYSYDENLTFAAADSIEVWGIVDNIARSITLNSLTIKEAVPKIFSTTYTL